MNDRGGLDPRQQPLKIRDPTVFLHPGLIAVNHALNMQGAHGSRPTITDQSETRAVRVGVDPGGGGS